MQMTISAVLSLGCFSLYGLGPSIPINGKLNTDAYCTILDDNVLPTLQQFYRVDPNYFLDNNTSHHVARVTKPWYGANGVNPIDCLQPRPQPYREPLGQVGLLNQGVHSLPKISEGTYMPSKLNDDAYCTIFDDNVLPRLQQFYRVDPYYFQGDNAICHVSRVTKAWYGANGVNRMNWPAQSPELNPLENLWDELDP